MKTFDSCACFPGQLTCVESNCPEEFDAAMKECTDAVSLADTCVLMCASGAYPDNAPADSTVVMSVMASVALSGLNVTAFRAVENAFKSALASTLSCSMEAIRITNVTEVSFRTLLAGNVSLPLGHQRYRVLQKAGSHLNIEFEVLVSSANDLKSTTSTLQGTLA
jgi:hypothetical protein